MPLYEYQCQQCREKREVVQKFSDPIETICPSCGGPVKKLISSPAIQFKGSGFYLTDYGKSGSAAAAAQKEGGAGEGSKSDSGSDSRSESKSESKPEAKADSKSDSKSDSKPESKSESKPKGGTESKSESTSRRDSSPTGSSAKPTSSGD